QTTTPGTYYYNCILSDGGTGCNSQTSNTVTVTVYPTPNSFTPTVSINPVCINTSGGTNIQVAPMPETAWNTSLYTFNSASYNVTYKLETSTGSTVGSPQTVN